MRFRVLLEIEAPDPGTPVENGKIVHPESWVWQDFFKDNGTQVKEAIIILPGFCGNCGEQVTFFDYLCKICRGRSMPGMPGYEGYK